MTDELHCKNCGYPIEQTEFDGLLHGDGVLECPPAFGTVAEFEASA